MLVRPRGEEPHVNIHVGKEKQRRVCLKAPRRDSQGLWGGLRCTAVALVPGSVSEGSVHLLLENVRQGMQRDAPDGGRVGKIAVQTAALKKKNTGIFRGLH